MAALPDINVLLSLAYDAHVHHRSAVSWLDTVNTKSELVLCRSTQLGFLRLLNNPAVMGTDVKTGAEVWEMWDALCADQRFRFAKEPDGFETNFRDLSGALVHQPKRWQDAYLAAFALAADLEFVTFDTGFRSFSGLRCRILGSARGG